MDIGDPTIYKCPLCGKKMQMTNWTSYTVSSSKSFSDGYVNQSGICCPDFTFDLAKCPHCKELFFRHNVKDEETVNFYVNKVKADIQDPELQDLIKAVKNKTFKKRDEEETLREMLWHEINRTVRLDDAENNDIYKLWKDNCAALIKLAEKKLKEIQAEENNKKHSKNAIGNCLFMMAELNRNLGKFDKCMELINELGSNWSWLKKQFEWECKAKNIYTFELITKKEMNLERSKEKYASEYYSRAKKFLQDYGRRNPKKALYDLNKAESLGMKDENLYTVRSEVYGEIGDKEAAEKDKLKAQEIENENLKKREEEAKRRALKKPTKNGKGIAEL